MAAKKKTSVASPSQKQSAAYHRLDTLLHTMRCITQHEDALCELSHDVRRTGALTPEASEELRRLLDKIPSQDLVHDLDAVSDLLGAPPAASNPVLAPEKKSKPSKKTSPT